MASRRLPDQTVIDRGEIAASISEDLRCLVLVLTRLFETETESGEALAHILNAKFAAERGLILSERLAKIPDAPNGADTTH
jgi:hypothetical protein